jgi:hypothetical protein
MPVSIRVIELAQRPGLMNQDKWHWLGPAERIEALKQLHIAPSSDSGEPHDYEVQDWDSLPIEVRASLTALGQWRP